MRSLQLTKNASTLASVLTLLCLMIISGSCGSDEGSEGYVMRFNANGALVEFTAGGSLTASFSKDDNQYIGVFIGSDDTRTMVLKVYDTEEIADTVYRQFEPKGSGFAGSLIAYEDGTGASYTQGVLVPDIRVRVTEITSTSVRGAFGGTLKADGKPDIAVTGGEFFVKRIN